MGGGNEDLIKTLQVMVVDDDPVFRHYLEAQLEMLGCQILPMEDGETAWNRIRCQPPDLVLSDVLMPGMSGVELCRRIKSAPDLQDLPVVLLTMAGSRAKDEGYRAGADDFLNKPPHLMELRTRLRNLLLLRSLRAVSAPPPLEPPAWTPTVRPPRLVVLESHGILRDYVKGTLSEEGLEIQGVDSVTRFHEALGQALPDLAILDQDLLEGPGSALVASLRTQAATANLPVLLMCNPGDMDPGGGAWNAGADEHLLKPFDPVELKARVHHLLQHADLQRRNDAHRLDADPSALKDPRSGAYTGAFLYACLDPLFGFAALAGQPVGLLACELPSPAPGESLTLLREVAGGMRGHLKSHEILCRVEEQLFVAVLPGVDLLGVVERAKALAAAWPSCRFAAVSGVQEPAPALLKRLRSQLRSGGGQEGARS